jgi:hypothetical protein
MDPRLNPQMNSAQAPAAPDPQAPPPAYPVTPPNPPAAHPAQQPAPAVPQPHTPPAAAPTSAAPVHEALKTELVQAIPVHQPGQGQAAPAPVIQMPNSPAPAAEQQPAKPHDDLDKILQAVNNRVATPAQPQSKPKKEIVKKLAAKAAKAKPANQNSKPIGLTLAVVTVVVALSVLAFRAYSQNGSAASLTNQPGKVGTSYTASGAIQSAGGTLVRPADMDDYSQELQKQLNSLNDSQDFASQDLSDKVLGL